MAFGAAAVSAMSPAACSTDKDDDYADVSTDALYGGPDVGADAYTLPDVSSDSVYGAPDAPSLFPDAARDAASDAEGSDGD